MEDTTHPMTPFDEMIGDERLQMLKAALPYLPRSGQQFLSLYVKTMELKSTFSLFQNTGLSVASLEEPPGDTSAMLHDISRFCHGEVKEQLEQLMQTMEMLQMLDLFQQP